MELLHGLLTGIEEDLLLFTLQQNNIIRTQEQCLTQNYVYGIVEIF